MTYFDSTDIEFAVQLLCKILSPISSKYNSIKEQTTYDYLLLEEDFVSFFEQFPFGYFFSLLFENNSIVRYYFIIFN